MSYFNLPPTTNVNRFIPKNAFDTVTNSKQKKKFAELIDKITWLNKISKETVNLTGTEIQEIQIFEVKLKEKVYPKELLDIIDKSIPYEIIFILSFKKDILLYTSKKHVHPINRDNAVIDWSFVSNWLLLEENSYKLNLKISLDFVYSDFCLQISNGPKELKDIGQLIEHDKKTKGLNKQVSDLERNINSEKQFKNKVELNIKLNKAKELLKKIGNC